MALLWTVKKKNERYKVGSQSRSIK